MGVISWYHFWFSKFLYFKQFWNLRSFQNYEPWSFLSPYPWVIRGSVISCKNEHLVQRVSVAQIERLQATQLFAPFPCVSSTQLTEYFVCYVHCLMPAYVISIICLLHMGRSVFASTFQNIIYFPSTHRVFSIYDGYSLADNMVFIKEEAEFVCVLILPLVLLLLHIILNSSSWVLWAHWILFFCMIPSTTRTCIFMKVFVLFWCVFLYFSARIYYDTLHFATKRIFENCTVSLFE